MLSNKDIKKRLLDETPEQWCVYLEMVEKRLDSFGFDNLRQFVTAPVNKGGLCISLERARWLIKFNPAYEAKAERLLEVLGVKAEIQDELKTKTQQEVADGLGVNQSVVSRSMTASHNSNARRVWLAADPEKAALKIREKFGDVFADQLKAVL